MHVITPSDLLKFQIEHYTEMLEKPRSFEHKIFLRKQLKQLQNGNCNEHIRWYSDNNGNIFFHMVMSERYKNIKEGLERIEAQN